MFVLRLSSIRAPIRPITSTFRAIGAQRSFQSCRILAVGKESKVRTYEPVITSPAQCKPLPGRNTIGGMLTDINADDEDRADKVEAEKNEQLEKAKKGQNEWEEELASDSESIVCCLLGQMFCIVCSDF